MGEKGRAQEALQGNRTFGRPRRRSGDMKIDFKEVGMGSANWINLAQYRNHWRSVMKMQTRFRVPQSAENDLSNINY
jgi:hypothetical protein